MSDADKIGLGGPTESLTDDMEEYEEEEVEVSDTEDYDAQDAKVPLPSDSTKVTPKGKSSGKVRPTEEVKKAPMESPESMSKKAATKLSPDKNPFSSIGVWNPQNIGEIDIVFPVLTGKNETTNELTRSTKPEARYWKAPIVFKYTNFTSDTMRFDNVHVPFHTAKGYGENFVYVSLPGCVGEAFAVAGKKNAPTKVVENSLMPDKERWWKIVNKVEGVFGVINNSTKKFQPKSLATIFDSTASGISCTLIVRFNCKASTEEAEALKPTTVRTVSAEVVRAFISATDINVQMPARVSRNKVKADPVAMTRDIASDDLMKRLNELGM